LIANGLQLGGDMSCDRAFTADGVGRDGVMSVVNASVGNRVDLRGADLRNPSGPAFVVDGLNVGRDALLDEGFSARGNGEAGAVRLRNTHVGGEMTGTKYLWISN
jgi:hypothetical protein